MVGWVLYESLERNQVSNKVTRRVMLDMEWMTPLQRRPSCVNVNLT